MARIYYEKDADRAALRAMRIAVIGFGSQGHAHALNLLDNGADVRVGLHAGSASRDAAAKSALRVLPVREAVMESSVVMLLVPDTVQKEVYESDIRPYLSDRHTLMFAHGFNIHYGQITPADGINVSMVAPKCPGHRLREIFTEGGGVPAIVAVHQDRTGTALRDALAYAAGIGCARAGVIESTFAEETETDLFGEQAVLCGGVSGLIKAGFETLVEAGYQPEIAYFECLHELKLIVDLIYQGGLSWMRHSVSDTAEWGDYTASGRVINEGVRAAMRELLGEVRSGAFASRWIQENAIGRTNLERLRESDRQHLIEQTGRELRRMMPFIQAREAGEVRRAATVS